MSIVKEFRTELLNVCIADSRNAMGSRAGQDAADAIKLAVAQKGFANVMFAAAPSQNETLQTLCQDPTIPWDRINAFHMDEYIGLEESHPAGFRNFLKKAIFDKFPFRSIHLLNGNAPDIQAEIQRYSQLLQDHPLDVVLLGIGENGHIAFNDPPVANFQDPAKVKIVELEERCRQQQVHDGCFDCIDQVPKYALTVTIPPIMEAKALFCSVPAPTKADAAAQLIHGPICLDCPASIMKTHPKATLYLDPDSAAKIH